MTLTAVNHRDLHRQFCARTKAAKGWNALRRQKDDDELAYLLRHHRDPPGRVSDPFEIEFRDRVDELLDYFGLLEIALHVGFIREADDPKYWSNVATILNQPAVRRFYVDHYPQTLPELLRRRLANNRQLRTVNAPPNLLIEFLSLTERLNSDKDLGRFLAFMDSFFFGDVTFSDVLDVLEDPTEVARHALRKRPEPIGQALRGFDKMLQFIVAFDSLSRRAKKWPTFEARLWHFGGYWFRQIRENFGSDLKYAVNVIGGWRAEKVTKGERALHTRHVRLLESAVKNVVYRKTPILGLQSSGVHRSKRDDADTLFARPLRGGTPRRRGSTQRPMKAVQVRRHAVEEEEEEKAEIDS